MSKAILITNGQHAFNQAIATRMLADGHRVALHVDRMEQAEAYQGALDAEAAQRLYVVDGQPADEESFLAIMDESVAWLGGLDVMIHGNEMLDEEKLLLEMSENFGNLISAVFERVFLWNKAAINVMLKKKAGKIVFPIIYDTLYYDGYPSSPVVNHGKISMMKCLSRECSAFRIDVNVMSFGYHDCGFDKSQKKDIQQKLEIFGLKPMLKPLDDMLGMLNFLIEAPGGLVGGQNLEIGVGVETNL